MHPYRTHTCGVLRLDDVGQEVRLSGWVHSKRDHGNLIFVDLRDHYGITQCVTESESLIAELEEVRVESVVTVTGFVVERPLETVNLKLPTGQVEVHITTLEVQSYAKVLPLQITEEESAGEEMRLRYRYLDLRRERMHQNVLLRSRIITSLRRRMTEQGFIEFQTPILTTSSPEGARDFLIPSRLHAGRFYALPQAPQQFKQLLMIAGFEKYFQIAPCFRDEDSRADRSPGEFYQLDFEMSFVTQEDVFAAIEPVLQGLFEEFGGFRRSVQPFVTPIPFPHIPYHTALSKYGTDKPDLRNPLLITDVSDIFNRTDVTFQAFQRLLLQGGVVRALCTPKIADKPRSFFDKLNDWSKEIGAHGLGYIVFQGQNPKGPIVKFLSSAALQLLRERMSVEEGDVVFFVCDEESTATRLAGQIRTKLGLLLDLIEKNSFRFCWITDFPLYEKNEETGTLQFSHNPFSMPQGGLQTLLTTPPLEIKAYQYDIVCNGVELSSGAIRTHLPEVMYKAFEIAGYSKEELHQQFGGMVTALMYGAPPHGGCAPGIERIVMLLADEPNLREIIAFPFNQRAEDLMLHAPTPVPQKRLNELHIQLRPPKK